MTHDPAAVVRSFYDGVSRRDAELLRELVETAFADDAAIVWPDSLPYGGRVAGRTVLGKVFAGLASGRAPIGPDNLELLDVVGDGDRIAAHITFDWRADEEVVATSALELWTFQKGLVQEIRAFYADTAACVALLGSPTTTPA